MQLTTENGTDLTDPGATELENALAGLGLPGNGFAILAKNEQYYLQTSGARLDGYVIEYRNGSETEHYTSKASDISHQEMLAIFLAYLGGGDWKNLIAWSGEFTDSSYSIHKHQTSKKRKGIERGWILALFFVIGVAFDAASFYLVFTTQAFLQRAVEVPGTVIEMVKRGSTYAPIVEYTDLTGQSRTLHTTQSSNPPSFHQGEQVVVLYDPSDSDFPLHAKIRSFGEIWGLALFSFIFGSAFAGMAVLQWFFMRRRKARQG